MVIVWFGWCPWVDTVSIVRINKVIIIIITNWLENIFIVVEFFIVFMCGIVIIAASNVIRIIGFFLFFIFSFDDKDVVYMNSVIMPVEKVMITTNGNHLEFISL